MNYIHKCEIPFKLQRFHGINTQECNTNIVYKEINTVEIHRYNLARVSCFLSLFVFVYYWLRNACIVLALFGPC